MIGQAVLCRTSGQAFEVPPDHCGARVQCPFCGADHPAPPIIPPPVERAPIVAAAPPVILRPSERLLRAAALGLTFLCGLAIGILAALGFAAANESAWRREFQRETQEIDLGRRNLAQAAADAARAAEAREAALRQRSIDLDRTELDLQAAIDAARIELDARRASITHTAPAP